MTAVDMRMVNCSLCGRSRRLKGHRVVQLTEPTRYRRPVGTEVTLQPGDYVCRIHSTVAELDAFTGRGTISTPPRTS